MKPSDGDFVFHPPRRGLDTVVLLPGLIAGRWIWQSTVDALAARGFGYLVLAQPWAVEHRQVAPLKHRVIDLMDRSGTASAVMVGGSFGSLVALDCALAFPERVDMLVLSGAPASVTIEQLGITFQGKATERIARTLLQRLFVDPHCVSEETIADTLTTFRDSRRLLNMIHLMRAADTYGFAAALAKIEAFVLTIWGRQDQISSCEVWQRLAVNVRDGAFFALDRCGHTPMIEQPEAFNRLLLEHLPRVNARRRLAAPSL